MRLSRAWSRIGLIGACLLALGALRCTDSSTAGVAASAVTGADAKPAPEFGLESVDGRTVTLSELSGKVLLIDFWATWCAPCREEIPMLNELEATYGPQGFQILAIADSTEDAEQVRAFVDEHGMQYTNLLGTDDVAERYMVLGLPTAFLVDPEGRIVETFVGAKPRRPLEEQIRTLLARVAG